jgi:hypothetical protein
VPVLEPVDGGFQERLGLLVAVPGMEDDPPEGPRGVGDEASPAPTDIQRLSGDLAAPSAKDIG